METPREPTPRRARLHETAVELEVPFHDVDMLGVVWHGHYLKYFEQARTALLRGRGLDAGDLIGRRYRFVVIESQCRHGFALRYGERVRATAWFGETARRVVVHYELHNLSAGRRAARGHTALATLGEEGELLLRTPGPVLERIHG